MSTIETPTSVDGVRIDRVVTHGTFSLDGGTWEVDNNVWILGDDKECVVIDAAHDAQAIAAAVGGRTVQAILLTHGHDDHINASGELCAICGAPRLLHPDDRMLWDREFDVAPEGELSDGQVIDVAGVRVEVLHTPGHAPGCCCFHVPALGVVFSGDTLFHGGPGATGRSFSDYDTIIESITTRLFALEPQTLVLTGHGQSTTIAAESAAAPTWQRPN